MKKEFYYIDELKTYIKLSSIVSISCNTKTKEYAQTTTERCCIVLFSDTVYWCNIKHFYELKNILNLID